MVFDVLETREAMGVYLVGNQNLALRAWVLNRLGSRSFADGRDHLDSADARVLGVRAVASEASAPRAEEIDAMLAYRRRVEDRVAKLKTAPLSNVGEEIAALERIVQG